MQMNYYEARLHTLPDAPKLRTATHQQLVAHHERLKIQNADVIEPRFGVGPDDENGFFESACYGVLEYEDYWRQCNLVWTWIDPKPVWVSAAEWDPWALPNPQKLCVRQFRLSLLGGGHIKVIEKFEHQLFDDLQLSRDVICYEPQLRVQAETEGGLRTSNGVVSHGAVCEMSAYAVLFPQGTPQDIANRTANTLRLIDRHTDNFSALLARDEWCCVCRRPLRDEVSKLLGIGPDCARQMKLPHNLETANRLLQRRRELLGSNAG